MPFGGTLSCAFSSPLCNGGPMCFELLHCVMQASAVAVQIPRRRVEVRVAKNLAHVVDRYASLVEA